MSNNNLVKDINDRVFEKEILRKDDKVVLLLVWNEVGLRCKDANCEILDAIEHEKLAGKVVYRRINGYESNKAYNYGYPTFPTVLVFKKGMHVQSISGVRDCDDIVEIVAQHLN